MAELRLPRQMSCMWEELDVYVRKYSCKAMGTWWVEKGAAAQGKH